MIKINNEFDRAQIVEYPSDNITVSSIFKVLLIDCGKIVECDLNSFYTCIGISVPDRQSLLRDIFKQPPACYECKLAEIQPTIFHQCGWAKNTINDFKQKVLNKEVEIEIYAFNHNDKVASVEVVLRNQRSSQRIQVGQSLVNRYLAKNCNESYTTMFNFYTTSNMQSNKFDIHRENQRITIQPQLLVKKVELEGPFSPIEFSSFEKTYRSFENFVRIDPSSVNSILIDPYPHDGVKKVLIAAAKSKNDRGKISLRQTTLMPHLNGIASIIALIFSPYAQIRFDKAKTRCTSILTGLGCDYSGKSYFGEHDSLFRTDVEFDNEDFEWINSLRCEMSKMMQNFEMNSQEIENTKSKCCSLMLKIVKKERLQVGESHKDEDNFNWNKSMNEGYPDFEEMFSVHNVKKIQPISLDSIKRICNNLRNLDQCVNSNSRDEELSCIACDDNMRTLMELKTHVLTAKHINLKTKYFNLSASTNLKDDDDFKRK